MKKLSMIAAVAALLFGSLSSYAQVKQYNFDLSFFNSIVVGGEFEVTLSQGDSYQAKITVEEPFREALTCDVHGQVLTVKIDDRKVSKDVKKLYKGKGAVTPVFKAVITTPEDISSITLEDKSSLTSTKEFNVESFKVNVSDNATLKAVTVNSQLATINTEKKGNASVNITTTELILNTNGNSSLNLTQTSKSIEANVSAFSNLTMHGDAENLVLNGKGSAKVVINGSIPSAKYNLNGGCNINAHELVSKVALVKMNSICTLSEAASDSLNVELAGGATLIFDNAPAINIEDIKNSNMRKYSSTVKK